MEHFTELVLSVVQHLGLPGLFAVMAVGNMGIPVGTEIIVPISGALAATGHLPSVWAAGATATAGEIVGGFLLYAIGYAGGRPFVAKYGRYLKLDEKKLDAFHAFYERHGNVVVFVCRFLPFVRGVAALPAGVSQMPKRYFLTYTTAGSAIFCFGLAWLGSLFGHHINELTPQLHRLSSLIIGLVALIVLAAVVWQVARLRRAPRIP